MICNTYRDKKVDHLSTAFKIQQIFCKAGQLYISVCFVTSYHFSVHNVYSTTIGTIFIVQAFLLSPLLISASRDSLHSGSAADHPAGSLAQIHDPIGHTGKAQK